MQTVNKNIIYNISSTLLSICSPLIIIPYLTSQLGMESYGVYMAIFSLCGIFSALGDLGLGMYLPKEISINRDNDEVLWELITSFIIIRFLTSLIMVFLSFIVIDGGGLLHILVAIFIIVQSLSFTLVYSGLERYRYLAISDLITKLLLIILVVNLDFTISGIEKAIGVQIIVLILLNLILIFDLFSKYKPRLVYYSTGNLFLMIKASSKFYFVGLFSNLYLQGSTYFVSLVLTSESVAIYSIANQIYRIGYAVVGGAVRVVYTSTARTKDFITLKKVTFISLCIHLAFIPIVYFFGNFILSEIFSFDTNILNNILFVFYVSLFFVIISSYWGYPAMTAIGKENYAHIGVILSSLVYMFVFVVSIFLFDVSLISVVICILISEIFGSIIRLYYAKKYRLL